MTLALFTFLFSPMKYIVRHRETGAALIEGEAASMKELLEKNRGANLGGAYLRDANLRGADLEGAYLEGADLEGAQITVSQKEDFLKMLRMDILP